MSRELAEQHGLASDRYPVSQEEAQKAEDILIADFASISLEEQEKLVFDIHGLPTINYESDIDACKAERLREVEKHLKVMAPTRKIAYDEACSLNPDYVKNLSEEFLEVHDGDAELTADQVAQHFENKKKLFHADDVNHPRDILARDILWSDLSAAEIHHLETSCVQMLPNRDAAGRVVVFCLLPSSQEVIDKPRMRGYWYFQQCLRHERGIASKGYVSVDFFMGKGKNPGIFDLKYVENVTNYLYDGIGLKIVVDHFCYDSNDDAMQTWVRGVALFSDEKYRHRIRFHHGDLNEVIFSLQTYGIPTHEFPITIIHTENSDGTSTESFEMKYDWHRQWLQSHRGREQDTASTASTASSSITIIPRQCDVLFGRGRDTRVHAGNLRAKQLVDMRFEEYEAANKAGKTVIAQEIVDTIFESHGRFLTRTTESSGNDSHSISDSSRTQEGWVEVDSDTARYKIAHFFRRRRNATSSKGNKRACGAD